MQLKKQNSRKCLIRILAAALMIAALCPASAMAEETSTVSVIKQDQDKTEEEILAEEAYNLRERYLEDIRLEEAYAARINYTQERAGTSVSQLMDTGSDIVRYALQWVGVTPYVWAGGSLWSGTDCSGFVHLIFAEFGYWLPTGSDAYQSGVGYHVSYEELKPGDIIVYGGGAHVGIYAGDDMVVHCSSPENGTVCWNMWYREPTAFVRVV